MDLHKKFIVKWASRARGLAALGSKATSLAPVAAQTRRPSWVTPVYAVGPAKGPYSRTISAARAGVSGSVFVCLAGHRLPIYSSGSSAESNKIVVNRPW
jgi:hypothetical protein